MEHSTNNSFIKKTLCAKEDTSSYEESGWTSYFEGFFASEKPAHTSGCSFSLWGAGSSSMVSDAASCAAWKPLAGPDASKSCKKLSLIKKRLVKGVYDDSLEDTASSPVNSPKVGDLNLLGMDPRKEDEINKDMPQKKNFNGSYAGATHEINEMESLMRSQMIA